MKDSRERVREIIKILRNQYPQSQTALHFKTPLQILIATILSAQSTDEKVNQITPSLFQKYKTVHDFATASQAELENDIRSTGFYRNKAKSVIKACQKIVQDFGGEIPENMEDLVKLPGVARKTANIVLSSAFHKAEGIAVDTHVKRLSYRLGLSSQKNPDKIEKDLMEIVSRENWLDFNYMLVNHGRRVCQAKKPRCPQCAVKHLCPSAGEFFSDLNS
ncbi:endonuclease III [bacterium]|nr:endonuclease III [bacterium]